MSDIRDRIAEALREHGRLCEDCTHAADYQDHVADVLVRELGLTVETHWLGPQRWWKTASQHLDENREWQWL